MGLDEARTLQQSVEGAPRVEMNPEVSILYDNGDNAKLPLLLPAMLSITYTCPGGVDVDVGARGRCAKRVLLQHIFSVFGFYLLSLCGSDC